MTFTKRFLMLLLLCILLIAIAITRNLHIEFFVSLNGLLLSLIILDYHITPMKKIFHIERLGDNKLSLLEEETISFKLYNKSDAIADIEVLLELEETFQCEEPILSGRIQPHAYKIFTLNIRPQKEESLYWRKST